MSESLPRPLEAYVTRLEMHHLSFGVWPASPNRDKHKYDITGFGEIWLRTYAGNAHVRFMLTKQTLRRDITFTAEDGKLFSTTFVAMDQDNRKQLAVAIKAAIRAAINQHIEAMLGLMRQPEESKNNA